MDDPLVIAGEQFGSRLIVGTGGAPTWTSWSGRWWRRAPS